MQCRVEALHNKRFPDVEDRLGVAPDSLSNSGIRFIGMKQDIGMTDCGGIGFSTAGETFEKRALVVGKLNIILAFPHDDYIGGILYNYHYSNEGQATLEGYKMIYHREIC